MPLTISETRQILKKLDHRPLKRLGQNFLIDGNIVRKALDYAAIEEGDAVIEIGPGLGTMTRPLLMAGASVYAIEKDRQLYAYLQSELEPQFKKNFHLMLGDALEQPFAGYQRAETVTFKVVANLPYAISTPWMDSILERPPFPKSLTLMLQKECADRLIALPKTKDFAAITLFLNGIYQKTASHRVNCTCFYPQPKVESLLIHFQLRDQPFYFDPQVKSAIRAIFSMRRKQLKSIIAVLKPRYPALEDWLLQLQKIGFTGTERPETIDFLYWQIMSSCFTLR